MNEDIYNQLPTLQQKVAVLGFTVASAAFIVWLVWHNRLREEHALLWFLGLLAGTAIVWVDPILAGFSGLMGIDLPANALVLSALFFLFAICIWLTSVASRNKRRLERMVIHVSILNQQLEELRAQRASPDGQPRTGGAAS